MTEPTTNPNPANTEHHPNKPRPATEPAASPNPANTEHHPNKPRPATEPAASPNPANTEHHPNKPRPATTTEPAVSFKAVSKWFRPKHRLVHALSRVSLDVRPSEFVSLNRSTLPSTVRLMCSNPILPGGRPAKRALPRTQQPPTKPPTEIPGLVLCRRNG